MYQPSTLLVLALMCMEFYVDLNGAYRYETKFKEGIEDVWRCRSMCKDTVGCTDYVFNEEDLICELIARKVGEEDAVPDAPNPAKIYGKMGECNPE